MNVIAGGMARRFATAGILAAVAIFGTPAWAAESLAGDWEIVTDAGGQEVVATLTIMEAEGKISGRMTSDLGEAEIVDPTYEDGVLTFDVTIDADGQALALAFEGKVDGDSIDANWVSDLGEFPATGTRGGGNVSPAGVWEVVTDAAGQEVLATLTITEAGGKISGSISGDAGTQDIANPSFEGGVLKFEITIDTDGQTLDLSFEGTIDGDSLEGSWGSDVGEFPATGTRGGGASPVGEWAIVTDAAGQEVLSTLTISETDGAISGSITGDAGTQDIANPSFEGGVLKFEITIDADGQSLDLAFEGTVDGDSMNVNWVSDVGEFPGTATRE